MQSRYTAPGGTGRPAVAVEAPPAGYEGVRSSYPQDRALHRLFESVVDARGESIALAFRAEALTYRELNGRANRLARHFRRRGVAPGDLVAIDIERSIELIVAVLAVLKAGAAYVPLDANYPPDRLRFMLDDARARLLVSLGASRVPMAAAATLWLDRDAAAIASESDANLDVDVPADALAYVMYTSGSTGRPKGVLVPHRAIVRLVRETNFASFGAEEVFLQLAPMAFDASTLEVFGPLLNGGRLAVMTPGVPSLDELGAALRTHGVTTLWLTAGLFHVMAQRRPQDLAGLRQLLAGGDVLSPTHVREVLQAMTEGRLINGYGPTENTTFTCCHSMSRGDDVGATVPIGRPIANTTVHILDEGMERVAIGEAGELYTGGDGLAWGYLGAPDLTADRFVPDPFSGVPGSRLYRTGDRARFLPDGAVEFLGRVDNQVKIRGFRIEPGEIEAAILRIDGVAAAAVVVREETRGDKRLVAYVVPRGDARPELRSTLGESLPEHMIPSASVWLDALPLGENGKVDRRALREGDAFKPAASARVEAPVSVLEEQIAALFRAALHTDAIDVNANFFDLGTSSLHIVEIHSRLAAALGREIPITALFKFHTVRSLAAHLGEGSVAERSSAAVDRAARQREAMQRSRETRPIRR